jgi:fucose permease
MAAVGQTGGGAPAREVALHTPQFRLALAGFFLSGVLFSFLGAILPLWRHHWTEDFLVVGNYFLALNVGILLAAALAGWVFPGKSVSFLLVLGTSLASGAFLVMALAPPAAGPWWRMVGILVLGCGNGLLNTGVFHAISPAYRHDAAATIILSGTFFSLGSMVTALLVAGTFRVYTVASILVFLALIPAYFLVVYARTASPESAGQRHPSIRQVLKDFRSPAAVLLTLVLFFQFGNEWSIAGWLALFLIQRLGVSPESSLVLLAVYWLALLVGRISALVVLPRIPHGRVLLGSVLAAVMGCAVLLSTDNRFGAIVGILLVGAGFAPIYPLVVEKIGGRFPYYHPGLFNGLFSCALTGGLLAPWSLGLFASRWGVKVVMWLPLCGTILVLLLLLLLWAETKLTGSEGWGPTRRGA